MQEIITYEQPLSERIRSFLRLEYLFRQNQHFLPDTSTWGSHAALANILEIQNLLGRSDLKTELLKELERHTGNLARLEQIPGVDRDRLSEILDSLDRLIDHLYSNSQPLGSELKHNEFLASVRQRLAIPGGTCDFDLPAYHHWLQQSSEHRLNDLTTWMASFNILEQAINIILQLVREGASPRPEVATEGFYQRSLDPNSPCQLLRIGIPAEYGCFPEVSGGKHRFSIRFMEQPTPNEKATQIQDEIDFELTCCSI